MMDANVENQVQDGATRAQRGLVLFLRRNIVAILIIAGLIAGYFIFRTAPSDVASIAELDARMAGSQPMLIEFYSNT